jgi:hypothetical protein
LEVEQLRIHLLASDGSNASTTVRWILISLLWYSLAY